MYTLLVIVLILGVVLALGLMAWIMMRGAAGQRDPLMGSRPDHFETARDRGLQAAPVRRIEVRDRDERRDVPDESVAPADDRTGSGLTGLTDDERAAVMDLVSRGRKIEAIKIVRERTGLGLKESKDFVEGLRPDDGLFR